MRRHRTECVLWRGLICAAAMLLAAGVLALFPTSAAGDTATLHAYPSGTAGVDCAQTADPSLQCSLTAALNVAISGDTIVLEADPSTSDATFATASGWTVHQDDLTITSAPGITATLDGGGEAELLLHYTGVGTLTIRQVTIANAHTTTGYGGGIYSGEGGTVAVSDSTFSGNVVDNSYGGGILNRGGGTVTVANTTFISNSSGGTATVGGGIVNTNGAVTVTNSTFIGNEATDHTYVSGAIFNQGTLVVTGSTFRGNTATGGYAIGGGVVTYGSGSSTIADSTFTGNDTADGAYGGGLLVYSGSAMVTASTFIDNDTNGGQGGGVHVYSYGSVTVTASTLIGNDTDGTGERGAESTSDTTARQRLPVRRSPTMSAMKTQRKVGAEAFTSMTTHRWQ